MAGRADILPHMPRSLSIGDVLLSAARSLWTCRWPIAVCFLTWTAVETVLMFAVDVLSPGRWALVLLFGSSILEALGLETFHILEEPIGLVPVYAARAVFIVLCLRILLTGLSLDDALGYLRSSVGIFLINVTWSVLFTFVGLSERFTAPTAGSEQMDLLPIIAVMYGTILFYVWIFSIFCLVYPSCALGRGPRVIACLRMAKGYRLKLFGIFVLLGVIIGVARGMVDGLIVRRFLAPFFDPQGIPSFGLEAMAWEAAGQALLIVSSMTILMAVSAVAYVRLTGFPGLAVPRAERTPEQLAGTFD